MPPRRNEASSPPTAEEWGRNLGRKISIRFKLHDDPAHGFSEAIGVVQSVRPNEAGVIVLGILTRRGETRYVPVDDILAAKLFPV
jgi:ribosome maturation factor RimP